MNWFLSLCNVLCCFVVLILFNQLVTFNQRRQPTSWLFRRATLAHTSLQQKEMNSQKA